MNNDIVSSESETTDSEASQPSEVEVNESVSAEESIDTQTAEEAVTTETDSSSEDVNTPAEGETDELVKQAEDEVQSEQGRSRVQQLANRAKAAEAELQKLQQAEQIKQQAAQQGNNDVVAQASQFIESERIAHLERKLEFQEAERRHPEVDKSSESYDKSIDDAAYDIYRGKRVSGEYISFSDAVADVKKLLQRTETKAVARAEQRISEKQTNSEKPQQRTVLRDDSSSLVEAKEQQFRKSRSVDDLADFLHAQRAG